MLPSVGPGELLIIMVIALLVFGPKKLPEIGKSVGNAMREFRKASSDFMDAMHDHSHIDDEQRPPVETVEYPTTPALSEPQNYESLPYGSDFYSGSGTADNGSGEHGTTAPHESAPHAAAAAATEVATADEHGAG